MAKSRQIGVAIIACAQVHSAFALCKEPAPPNCVEPFIETGEEHAVDSWALWKSTHSRTYESDEEEAYRRSVWEENTEYMMRVNAKPNITYSLGWHSRSDLTPDEFARFKGLKRKNRTSIEGAFGSTHRGTLTYDGKLTDLPSDWDWSSADTEVVTSVKDQQCGDCWAFSAAAGLEGALAVAIGWTTSLSVQQLVDCAHKAGSCSGGEEQDGMDWAKDNFACAWHGYAETGERGSCKKNCKQIITPGSIWGTYTVTANDEGALCSALIQRPMTVAVGCDHGFDHYKSGIYDHKTDASVDHAVLAVGYGYYNGKAYWKIKNSWGTSWGLDGYILLARGDGKNQNKVMEYPIGVYVYGPYNPDTFLTNLQGERISPPTQAMVVA